MKPRRNPSKTKICLFNLDENVQDEDLRNIFEEFGDVVKVNRVQSNSKWLTFVTYADADAASTALKVLRSRNYEANFAYERNECALPNRDNMCANKIEDKPTEMDPHTLNDVNNKVQSCEYCVFCAKTAAFQCERCSDFYCSSKCQTADWSAHRPTCFPKPRLIPAVIYSENIALASEVQRSHNQIQSTTISSTESNEYRHTDTGISSSVKNDTSEPSNTCTPKKEQFGARSLRQPSTPINERLNISRVSSIDNTIIEKTQSIDNINSEVDQIDSMAISSKPKDNPFRNRGALSKNLLENNENIEKRESIEPKSIETGGRAYITYAANHYTVFVRTADPKLHTDYMKLLKSVDSFAKTANSLTDLPKRDDIVAAYFLDAYYRAVVLRVETMDQPIRVAFIDFGNVDSIKTDQVRLLSDELKYAPRFIIKCYLSNVDREMGNPEGLNRLHEMENTTEVILRCKSGSITKDSEITMIEANTGVIINATLSKKKEELSHEYLSSNTKKIFVLETKLPKGLFYCIAASNKKLFSNNDDLVQKLGDKMINQPELKPCIGDYVLVHVFLEDERCWYRAECKAFPAPGTVKLLLIDYGTECESEVKYIRRLPDEGKFQIITNECRIKGCNEDNMTPNMISKFTELLPIFEDVAVSQVQIDGNETIVSFSN